MGTILSQLKLYISSLLLALGIMASAGTAFAVTGGDFGIGELPPGTEITIFGPGLTEKGQVVTVDKNKHFDAEIPCIPGASYHAEWVDKNGKRHRSTDPYICPEAAAGSNTAWWILGGGLLAAGTYGIATQNFDTPAAAPTTTPPAGGLYPHTGTCTGTCGYPGPYSVTCTPATGAATACDWTFSGGAGAPVATTCGAGSCSGTGFMPPAGVGAHSGFASLTNGSDPSGGSSWSISNALGGCSQTCN